MAKENPAGGRPRSKARARARARTGWTFPRERSYAAPGHPRFHCTSSLPTSATEGPWGWADENMHCRERCLLAAFVAHPFPPF
jgi:hypothetical protein